MELKDAIKCIQNSTICTSERYKWIQPLITQVLTDALSEDSLENFICLLFNKPKNKNKLPLIASQLPKVTSNHIIKQIISIDCISNVGLLDFNKPIKLYSGINAIYGKNGAGKSTIFIGLCKIIGKNKIAHANILYPSKDSICTFTFKDEVGNEKQLSWKSGTENSELQVMIFDSQISNFLVEKDQINNFEIAHLKMEYFVFLHNLYEKVYKELENQKEKLNFERSSLNSILTTNIPYVLTDKYTFNKDKLVSLQFTTENEEVLAKIQSEIETLEKKDLKSIIKNLATVNTFIHKILNSIARKTLKISIDGKSEEVWSLIYNKSYFEELDKKINKYNKSKKDFEEKGIKTLDLLIPSDWVTNQKWIDFINLSINFVNSIQNKEYLDKKCLYCQQELNDDDSKNLIKAYSEIHKQNEINLQSKKQEILRIAESINISNSNINDSISNLHIIEAELEHIGKKGSNVVKLDKIKLLLDNLYEKTKKFTRINLKDEEIQTIQEILLYYSDLYINFDGEIKKLQSLALSNDKKHTDLKTSRDNLLTKKRGVENKEKIIQYFELQNKLIDIKSKTEDLSVLKQLTSSLKTKFMQESSVVEFKKYLQQEYEALNFKPPQNWELVTSTSSGSSKRSYSLGDIKLAEVFSDGEKKIHALADFFAQLDLNEFKGVYIFDDPVTSLDEDNMEYVTDRIIKLVEDGNQVIIFTHNLVFLNMLIDTQKNKIHKIMKLESQIIIESDLKIGTEMELKFKLKEIESRVMKLKPLPLTDISILDVRNVYDLISGYLEDYVEVVYFKNIINRYRPNIRMNSLCELKAIDITIIEKLSSLYEKTSRKGSRHSQPIGVPEPKLEQLLIDFEELKKNFPLKN